MKTDFVELLLSGLVANRQQVLERFKNVSDETNYLNFNDTGKELESILEQTKRFISEFVF